ncbi:hypothetical protein H2O64_03355 [Kordia sp. YSTF-M3]|uniref:Lipocalin-like domain-containing protein n=1 Tax=Kordia aestuariivivens TaxID=2759037 RepID=A0ABR7Q567_9FLAO|nr:hypothetical protein [Kordia aestuariivivens]MBC8753690.1 hypothetical protein [Kordia aestuariivivens]
MKKLIFTALILGIVTACSVDNVESDLIPVSGEEVTASDIECVPDASNPPTILGSTWLRTSFIIETDIDGNGDGIFSNELLDESSCGTVILRFLDNFKADNPVLNNMYLDVDDDGNGNLSQRVDCLIGDGLFPFYTQNGNIISFCYLGQLEFIGTLSTDGQTLVFDFPYEDLFFTNNSVLKPDGTVEAFQGNGIITYTLQ